MTDSSFSRNLAAFLSWATPGQLAEIAGALAAECLHRGVQGTVDLIRLQGRLETLSDARSSAEMIAACARHQQGDLPREHYALHRGEEVVACDRAVPFLMPSDQGIEGYRPIRAEEMIP